MRQGLGLRGREGALKGVVRSLALILNNSVRLPEKILRQKSEMLRSPRACRLLCDRNVRARRTEARGLGEASRCFCASSCSVSRPLLHVRCQSLSPLVSGEARGRLGVRQRLLENRESLR